jgi:transcriptional regulator with XRE-family HTH domain
MTALLAKLLREDIERRQWSERQMARNIGLSATTVNRFLAGDDIDLETVIKICKWLKVPPSEALDAMIPDTPEGTRAQLALMLDADPKLEQMFFELAEKIASGKVPPSALREALEYIEFRYGRTT